MKRIIRIIAISLTTSLALWGCGGGGSSGGDTADAGGQAGAGGESMGAGGTAGAGGAAGAGGVVNQTPGDCAFDTAQAGKGPGKQIENFPLEMWNGERFDFHNNCGGTTKAVWVFLSTGWCGACENYARTVQEFYMQYRGQGLEVVWIVGEDQNHEPPTPEYMQQYKEAKMADFTIIRDNGFFQTRRYIDPSAAGNILPRQYVLDASNMLMVYAGGRPFAEGECEMKKLLGVLDTGTDCVAFAENQ